MKILEKIKKKKKRIIGVKIIKKLKKSINSIIMSILINSTYGIGDFTVGHYTIFM